MEALERRSFVPNLFEKVGSISGLRKERVVDLRYPSWEGAMRRKISFEEIWQGKLALISTAPIATPDASVVRSNGSEKLGSANVMRWVMASLSLVKALLAAAFHVNEGVWKTKTEMGLWRVEYDGRMVWWWESAVVVVRRVGPEMVDLVTHGDPLTLNDNWGIEKSARMGPKELNHASPRMTSAPCTGMTNKGTSNRVPVISVEVVKIGLDGVMLGEWMDISFSYISTKPDRKAI
ncbi:hypothetical protein Tco_0548758 [Tanacetum coccineum]